jgi:acetyl esterase/lipase
MPEYRNQKLMAFMKIIGYTLLIKRKINFLFIVAMFLFSVSIYAQPLDTPEWKNLLRENYNITYNVLYSSVDTILCRLDVYQPKNLIEPAPAFIWFHGGGWARGTKDSSHANTLTFIKMGWIVLNVNYRLAPAALAPAAVEDSRCALRWVIRNAQKINIDKERIVIGGGSAGGHLAMMAGMLSDGNPFDNLCAGSEQLKVAAILNLNGNVDVKDMLDGPHKRGFATRWIGDRPNRDSIADVVSPINYVRKYLPPIMSVHGDADSTVPYEQAVRLHEALAKVGAEQELLTIHDGGHGKYGKAIDDYIEIKIQAFLKKYKIIN